MGYACKLSDSEIMVDITSRAPDIFQVHNANVNITAVYDKKPKWIRVYENWSSYSTCRIYNTKLKNNKFGIAYASNINPYYNWSENEVVNNVYYGITINDLQDGTTQVIYGPGGNRAVRTSIWF